MDEKERSFQASVAQFGCSLAPLKSAQDRHSCAVSSPHRICVGPVLRRKLGWAERESLGIFKTSHCAVIVTTSDVGLERVIDVGATLSQSCRHPSATPGGRNTNRLFDLCRANRSALANIPSQRRAHRSKPFSQSV